MSSDKMSGLQLQKYLERNSIKHPTALLHFERQLSDFEQGVLFLCVHIVAKTERGTDGFYYLNKSLVRAVMRQESNQDYARISEAVDRVSDTKLKFNFLGEDRTFDSYKAPLIIGQAGHQKRGVIAFEVHPRIEKLIKDPRVFSRLNIYFIAALSDVKRGYSFYALMKDFVDRTKSEEVTLDYWELRSYLGVEEGAYSAFKAFKQWVLKPLIEAVNEQTDLQISYMPVKTGRKLTHLKFTIKRQSWQLQLFEREHVERMIGELAKTFDGPVIEGKSTALEAPQDAVTRELTKRAGTHGVSADTVERAITKHGEQAVGEIIDHAERQFKKKTAKGEDYRAGDYLASLLNRGAGQKTPAQRRKAEEAAQRKAERDALKLAQAAKSQAADELQKRWTAYRQRRFAELTESRTDTEVAELGELVTAGIAGLPPTVKTRWRELNKDFRQLGTRKVADKSIRAIVTGEVFKRWGQPADNDLEVFKAVESEAT